MRRLILSLVFLLAIVAFAVGKTPSISKLLCSVNATGIADIMTSNEGEPSHAYYSVKMFRVKNTARYEFYDSRLGLVSTVIVRPDLDTCFYYDSSSCISFKIPYMSHYPYVGTTKDGLIGYGYDEKAGAFFDSVTFEFISEFFFITESKTVICEWESVNYDYQHKDEDDLFSLKNSKCPSEAETKATFASSSEQCHIVEMPDNLCSVTAVGTTSVPWIGGSLTVRMIRVNDYVRYDLFANSQMVQPSLASFLLRPDLNSSFFSRISSPCIALNHCYLSSDYAYDGTQGGLDVFSHEGGLLFFDRNHELVKETILLYDDDAGYIPITFNYSSVDHNYEHNDEDSTFSLNFDEGACSSAKAIATDAKSSLCPKTLTPVFPRASFQYKVDSYAYNVYFRDFDFGFLTVSLTTSDELVALVRCDVMDKYGRCLVLLDPGTEECFEDYDYFENWLGIEKFKYVDEPSHTQCPDGSDCMEYCVSLDCIVVDSEGRFVSVMGNPIEYTNYTPTPQDFAGAKCDGENLEPPVFASSSSSSSNSGSSSASSSSAKPVPISSTSLSSVHSSEVSNLSSGCIHIPSVLLLAILLYFF